MKHATPTASHSSGGLRGKWVEGVGLSEGRASATVFHTSLLSTLAAADFSREDHAVLHQQNVGNRTEYERLFWSCPLTGGPLLPAGRPCPAASLPPDSQVLFVPGQRQEL